MLTTNLTESVERATVAVKEHRSIGKDSRAETRALRSVDHGSIRESSSREVNGMQEFEVRVPIDLYDVGGNRFHHRRACHHESVNLR